MRGDTFKVGDVVDWHIPTAMQHCVTWAPDFTKPVEVISVRSAGNDALQRAAGHTQIVRVTPNYCPYGDEFSGAWFKPAADKETR